MEQRFPGRRRLAPILDSAARLQELVPDAVLVGGTAAALYAGHLDLEDHDHVLADLADRFDVVLEALESEPDWVTNRVQPGKLILGSFKVFYAGKPAARMIGLTLHMSCLAPIPGPLGLVITGWPLVLVGL